MEFSVVIERVGQAVDGAGVVLIVLGLLLTTVRFLLGAWRDGYTAYRGTAKD